MRGVGIWYPKNYNERTSTFLLSRTGFAFDKHNQKGRSMGRGWKHFFEEGTQLSNHREQPNEEEYKEKARKYAPEPVQKPEDEDSNQRSFWIV
ncbi:MAG: hypothetical protein AAGI07_05300 [Bacteroidota bacterium]